MNFNDVIGCDAGFDAEVTGLSYDSRNVKPGDAFFCLKGFTTDGHAYAMNAYEAGARVFVAQDKLALPSDAFVYYTDNTRRALALASASFFGHPAEKMTVIGVTGTKGKTGTAFMLKYIFEAAGKNVGLICTNGIYYGNNSRVSYHSTPESYVIHESLRKMLDYGCDTVIIEASSQGFLMHRTDGIVFDACIFTNISPDHIGPSEHDSFENYLECKKMLLRQSKVAFINGETDYYAQIIAAIECPIFTFGRGEDADLYVTDPLFGFEGHKMLTSFTCVYRGERFRARLGIPGYFSLYNAAGAISVASYFGLNREAILKGLESVTVEGRMEVLDTGTDYTVIIDFAHNALSCQKLFETIAEYHPKRTISLFGCGGNRSLLRRYDMGEIIGSHSDITIVTTDNPRTESLESINADIKKGLDKTQTKQIFIDDRKTAIETALDLAEAGDIVLLIGKGHEHYDEIGDVKYPLFESQIVADHLAAKRK